MNRQTWFVTGAASRLGADIVRAALASGHQVVAADADPLAALRRIGSRDKSDDRRLLAVALDAVDTRAVAGAVAAAVDRFGAIDVLVHGAADCSPLSEFDPPRHHDFSACVRSLFNVTRGVLEVMREQHAGRIHHLVPAPDKARGPALFSIAGFCQSVAADVAPFGIEVTAVPGHAAIKLLRRGRDELLEWA